MSIRVQYETKSLKQTGGQPSKEYERSFASLEAAKAAPFPEGYWFTYIPSDNGFWVYEPRFGWEFHKEFYKK